MGQVHAIRHLGQVFVVDVLANFVIQPFTQLDQVLTGGADTHKAAARTEQALGFVPVQRAEDAGQKLAAGIGQGHPGHARHQPGHLGAALAGTLDRFAGNIQGITIGMGHRRGQLRGVIPFTAADIQPACRPAIGRELGQALGHRCVVAGVEEVAPGLHHGLVVAGVAAVLVLHRQQVQVTLASTVETVAGRAYNAIVDSGQGRCADRAGEHQASNLTRVR
ncbi:hypothetical protein D9M71_237060 [compost metagenome]